MKLGMLAAAAAAASMLIAPSISAASPNIRFGVQDDAFLATGPSVEPKLDTLDRLGAKLVRYTVNWRQIAGKKPVRATNPNDPAYDWARTDKILKGLRDHRIQVLVTLYGTPGWANGGLGANGMPRSKSSLAAFAVAVVKRYPWIRMWEIWNEPNLRRFLNPNSPRLYVQRLLNPTVAALHGVSSANRVAGGATSPRPTPSGMSPVSFMRGMHTARARLDAYAHHPYPVTRRETPWGFAPGACRYCKGVLTLANLPSLLREVKRDFGRKRIWLTEYGYQTNPPDRFGVSPNMQANYVSQAALRAKSARYVDVLIHFIVKDEPHVAGWQSGFLTSKGSIKPSFFAFMLPIAQVSRHGSRTTIWGQVRPGFGQRPYRLQRLVRGQWRGVGHVKYTDRRGSYLRVVRAHRGDRYRVVWPTDGSISRTIAIR